MSFVFSLYCVGRLAYMLLMLTSFLVTKPNLRGKGKEIGLSRQFDSGRVWSALAKAKCYWSFGLYQFWGWIYYPPIEGFWNKLIKSLPYSLLICSCLVNVPIYGDFWEVALVFLYAYACWSNPRTPEVFTSKIRCIFLGIAIYILGFFSWELLYPQLVSFLFLWQTVVASGRHCWVAEFWNLRKACGCKFEHWTTL